MTNHSKNISLDKIDESVRIRFIIIGSFLVTPIALVIGAIHLLAGNFTPGIIDVVTGTVLLFNAYLLQFTKKYFQVARIVVLAIISGLFFSLLFTGGLNGTGLYWSAVLPLVFIFMFGNNAGLLLNGAFLAGLLGLAIAGDKGWFEAAYTIPEVLQIALIILVESGLVYLFQREINNRNEEILKEKMSINKTTAELRKQIEDNRIKSEKLGEAALQSIKDQEKLEKSQSAMADLLDDLEKERNKLRELNRRDEALLLSIGEGLIVTDEYGQIIRINGQLEKMLGQTKKTLIGQPLTKIIKATKPDGSPVPPEERVVVEALSTGEPQVATYKLELHSGNFIFCQIVASPFLVDDKPVGAVVVLRDISEQVSIDRAKTEFVSLASHQLRTPLSAVSWYTEMLLNGDMGKLNQDQHENLNQVYRANQRMIALVDSLLNVSRVELGTFSLEPVEVNIKEIIDTVLSDLQGQIAAKKQKVTKHLPANIPHILADKKIIHIVVQNLVSNAVKYTPDKGRIELTLKAGKRSLDFIVKDSGYGIPQAQQNKIFTKLFRADNVVAMDMDGNGLGLYLVKEVLEETGGSIKFTSKENQGSIFTVKLPLKSKAHARNGKILSPRT